MFGDVKIRIILFFFQLSENYNDDLIQALMKIMEQASIHGRHIQNELK